MINSDLEMLDPVDFVGSKGRLFFDTNVFMDTDPERKGRIGVLLRRCAEVIKANRNPIVVVTKVVEELKRQSRMVDPERVDAIAKARVALDFLEDAGAHGLVRTDIGDPSNPYADDLFVKIFEIYSRHYDMCLLTNDVTLRLRIALLPDNGKRLVAGTLAKDGEIEVASAQVLYEKGLRKLKRKQADGDEREVAALEPLLTAFQQRYGTTEPRQTPSALRRIKPFDGGVELKPADEVLNVSEVPGIGDKVQVEFPSGTVTLVLKDKLGDGAEGAAFAVEGERVVKIFNREHITRHRKEKVSLLAARGLHEQGICFPEGIVTNARGEFVGYIMPRARGNEFRVIMNPRRFLKSFPGWTKEDLVDVCISFLEKVVFLHSLNVILGDINPKNLIVDANKNVWIIDVDSWQVEGYPSPVGTPMFTAPSALGKPYAEFLRTVDEELFAVATMLFMVLITGQFPYARAGSDGDIVRLIKDGNFAFQVGDRSNRDQPEGNWKYMWSHMPRDLKELFWNTFHWEGSRFIQRPTAGEWLRAFREYKWWLGSDKNFDPISNNVYPFRFKAFRPDTPILDCPQCGRQHAIVGEWSDATQQHSVPDLCFDCQQQNRPKCQDCGTPKPEGALRDGRCRECNHKRNSGNCEECNKEIAARYLVGGRCSTCQQEACRSCNGVFLKSELHYGRCKECAKKGSELDPSRLCRDCGHPFINFDHIAYFNEKGLAVPKSHARIKQQCPNSLPQSTATARSKDTASQHQFGLSLGQLLRSFFDR